MEAQVKRVSEAGQQPPKPAAGRRRRTGREAEWWQAVLAHDARYDGAFVYAVESTGVYCRASCPSRRPAFEKVRFFSGAEAAEKAGFRACRRCRPRSASSDGGSQAVSRACRVIEASPEEPFSLGALAAEAGTSARRLSRMFRRALGVTPWQYAAAARNRLLKSRLKGAANVTDAVFEAGYGSTSRVYEKAHALLGMSPRQYRREGQGMRIRYAISACALGRLLVAATDRGICAVQLGDDDAELEAALRAEYPAAEIRRSPADLTRWMEPVSRLASGAAAEAVASARLVPGLPLDISATAFQLRVWRALTRIPAGQTRSYGEVAKSIGRDGAARAVARACASNPVALLIPCHRVVRDDGSAGGYRWGPRRKAKLLAMERKGLSD